MRKNKKIFCLKSFSFSWAVRSHTTHPLSYTIAVNSFQISNLNKKWKQHNFEKIMHALIIFLIVLLNFYKFVFFISVFHNFFAIFLNVGSDFLKILSMC